MADHIKIGDVSPRTQYTANGSVTTFAFPFPIFEASDLLVYLDGALQSSGYTVSGAGETDGGSAVFASAPGNGVIVTLGRSVPIARTTDFQDGGAFRAAVINEELDRLVCMAQQLREDLDRTVRRPLTSTSAAALSLPDPIPGRALKFAADGALGLSDGDPDAAQSDAAAQVALAAAQAGLAAAAKTSAEAARDQVLALYDDLDDRYLGVHASDPTTDNDGNPLFPGALYFQQTEPDAEGVMKVYTGVAWVAAYVNGDSILTAENLLALLATLTSPQQATALASLGGASTASVDALKDVGSVVRTSGYTIQLTDRGKSIDTTAQLGIPTNADVPFPIGSTVSFANTSASSITITQAAGVTLRQAGTTNTGNRTLAAYGVATVRKVDTDLWFISGAGLS